jgi:hypothetical protein
MLLKTNKLPTRVAEAILSAPVAAQQDLCTIHQTHGVSEAWIRQRVRQLKNSGGTKKVKAPKRTAKAATVHSCPQCGHNFTS